MAAFNHHLSPKQYAEGLKAELRTATDKAHKEAIQAELTALAAATEAAPAATETR